MSNKKTIKDRLDDAVDDSIKQISGTDATFLYTDFSSSPMHIGSLTIVEGSLKFEDFKAIIASKLHLIPKFRQRLLKVPLNLDYPYWVDDPNFNLDLHLNRIKLPDPADWETLREVTSSIFSDALDKRRPLWSLTFIEGLDEISQIPKGSVAILLKIHHVMIDGKSGVGVMSVLFDQNQENKHKPAPEPKPYNPEPLPDDISLLLKSSYNFLKDPLKVPKVISETAFSVIKDQAAKSMMGKKEFDRKNFSVPKTIFNESVSPKKTWGTAILSFDRIYNLKQIMGVTVNDVILAICGGAIRKYLLEKDKLPSQSLVANVPISVRKKGGENKMDNQISSMLVQIGTHIEDPIERLKFIQEVTDIGKIKNKADGAKKLLQMANMAPFGLANLAANVYTTYNIKDLHRPPFNVTISNVPGPRNMLYIKGHKIVTIFGLTPVLDGFGLIIAAFSYNGLITLTATSDAHTMPDIDVFSRYMRESANTLEKDVKKRGKQDATAKAAKLKSTAFFTAFRKYIKENPKLFKTNKAIFEFQVNSKYTEGFWQLDMTKATAELKKKKSKNATATIHIEDDNLFGLFKGDFLIEELVIQDRINFSGKKADIMKITKLLTQFLIK